MSNTEKKIMPPLWIWVALFTLVIIVTAFYYVVGLNKKKREFEARTIYLKNELKKAGHHDIILFIGSSPTKSALTSSPEIATCLKKDSATAPVILKIWREETSLETMLEAMPFLQEIRPRLLVAEANMLLYASEENLFIKETQNAIFYLLRFRFKNPFSIPDYDPDKKPPQEKKDYRPIVKRGKVADTTRLVSFRKFANNLQLKGTKVILLNIPLEASEEIKKWKSPDTVLFNRNYKYIRNKVAFKYYTPKFRWGMDHYSDRGHMNEKGRKAFSTWLCSKLAGEL